MTLGVVLAVRAGAVLFLLASPLLALLSIGKIITEKKVEVVDVVMIVVGLGILALFIWG